MTAPSEKSPAVSVVVPSYRAGPYLGELCASLGRQTFADFEVLILSDGCDDHREPGVLAWADDPRFRIASWRPNRGVAAATAQLLAQVRGEFWCYPGADDLLDPAFLAERMAGMRARPAVDVLFGPGRQIDGAGRAIVYAPLQAVQDRLEAWAGQAIEPVRLLPVLLQENVINTPSVLCRSARTIPPLLAQPVPWRYGQDLHYWIRLAATGCVFGYDPRVLHCYRIHSGQMSAATELAAVRLAEQRLVPLVALAESAHRSAPAAQCWRNWRHDLYALWLLRAAKLARARRLDPAWLIYGLRAYRNRPGGLIQAWCDLAVRLPGALRLHRAERKRAAGQIFVNGLRRIDDPLFRLRHDS